MASYKSVPVVIFFGFNDPRKHARGVEFVIQAQSAAVDTPYYVFLGDVEEEFLWGRIRCVSIKRGKWWPVRLNQWVMRMKRLYPKVLVHAHNYLMASVLVSKIDVFTVHDGLAYLKSSMGSGSPLWPWIEAHVYRRSRLVHFISDYARSMAHPVGVQGRHVTIHNTCSRELMDTEAAPAGPVSAGSAAEVLPRPYALIVRSIEERAGLDIVIEASALLVQEQCELDIVIAGKGPLLDHYRALAERAGTGRVKLLGYVSDERLASLYRGACMTITPALYGEGFGLPVVESYFYGRVALASRVCALPEVVLAPEFLFENTPRALADAILAVRSGRLAADPLTCRDYYDKRFGFLRYTQELKGIYRSLNS